MKNQALIRIRIISMILIAICHLGSYYSSTAIGQLFSVGVPIFLFLSGFLYGKKNITNWTDWSKNRWVTLMVPLYIWLGILTVCAHIFYSAAPSVLSWKLIICNLQGLGFIVDYLGWMHASAGLGHLWFITAIMLCYALLPLLQKLRPWISSLSCGKIVLLITGGFIVKCCCDYWLGLHLGYFITFCIGYFWSRSFHVPSTRGAWLWCTVAVISCAMRMGCKYMLIDSLFYMHVIVAITHPALGIAIFNIIYYIHTKTTHSLQYNTLYTNIVQYIDKLTYYIYITHYVFLAGTYNVKYYAENSFSMQLILFTFFTIGSAILLERLCYYPVRWITAKKS